MIRTTASQQSVYNTVLSAYRQNVGRNSKNNGKSTLHIGMGCASSVREYVIEAPLMKKIELRDNSRKLVITESENADMQNDYYRNAETGSIARMGYTSGILDLSCLVINTNAESCFQGTINGAEDVDYYHLDTMSQMISKRPVYVTMEAPEGCHMTVYDKNGNQVGMSERNADGTQTLKVPSDWSSSTGFMLKIEGSHGETGQEGDIPYKLTFRQGEMDPEFKALLERNKKKKVYETPVGGEEADRKNNWNISEMNTIRRENNEKKTQELHEKQYQSLPKELQYHGTETEKELLARKRNGEKLTEAEEAYLQIYGNLADLAQIEMDQRISKAEKELKQALSEAGIDISDNAYDDASEGSCDGSYNKMHVKINPDGSVKVSGLSESDNKKAAAIIAEGGFADILKNGYLAKSETVKNMTYSQYRTAMFTEELDRVLLKASGGRITVDDIRRVNRNEGGIVTDYYLEGLPASLDGLINNPPQDSIYEEYSSMLYLVLADRELTQDMPRFSVEMDIGAEGILFL